MKHGWVMSVAVVCALFFSSVNRVRAAEYLSPEWSVGQEQVSSQMLAVTPPIPAPVELTVQDAVNLALERNIGFRRTVQNLLGAGSSFAAARQRWRLNLLGSVETVHNDESVTNSSAGALLTYAAVTGADFSVSAEMNRIDSEESQIVSASLTQPLLAGAGPASASYEELRLARNFYRSSLLSYFVDRQALLVSVISSYFDAVQQQRFVSIQEASVALAEQAAKDAQLRLEAGLIAEIDLTRAQLRVARAQTDAVLARQAARDSLDRLLLLLGLQVGGDPRLVTTVSYQPSPLDSDAAVKQAMERRPEIRLALLDIENRRAALRISRSANLPELDLFAGFQRIGDTTDIKNWNVGLQASVPVANRPLREAVRQAQWALLVAEQERENTKQQITSEVRSQVRAAEAAQANVDIATRSLEVSERSLYIAGRMVEEGLAENRNLLDAQDDLRRSQLSLVSSKINYYLATVRLREAMGIDIAADLPTSRVEEGEGMAVKHNNLTSGLPGDK